MVVVVSMNALIATIVADFLFSAGSNIKKMAKKQEDATEYTDRCAHGVH